MLRLQTSKLPEVFCILLHHAAACLNKQRRERSSLRPSWLMRAGTCSSYLKGTKVWYIDNSTTWLRVLHRISQFLHLKFGRLQLSPGWGAWSATPCFVLQILPCLHPPHCPVAAYIEFKSLVLTYKAGKGATPRYLQAVCSAHFNCYSNSPFPAAPCSSLHPELVHFLANPMLQWPSKSS